MDIKTQRTLLIVIAIIGWLAAGWFYLLFNQVSKDKLELLQERSGKISRTVLR